MSSSVFLLTGQNTMQTTSSIQTLSFSRQTWPIWIKLLLRRVVFTLIFGQSKFFTRQSRCFNVTYEAFAKSWWGYTSKTLVSVGKTDSLGIILQSEKYAVQRWEWGIVIYMNEAGTRLGTGGLRRFFFLSPPFLSEDISSWMTQPGQNLATHLICATNPLKMGGAS